MNPKATYSQWRSFEVSPCYNTMVKEIQMVLKQRGYYSGELDNIFGTKTKTAFLHFQKDNNLKQGIVGEDSLKVLGLYKEDKEIEEVE